MYVKSKMLGLPVCEIFDLLVQLISPFFLFLVTFFRSIQFPLQFSDTIEKTKMGKSFTMEVQNATTQLTQNEPW